jgi:hypothetical protein
MPRTHRFHAAVAAALLGSSLPGAWAQTRGEMLYATHCVACHTTQMHWRDKRAAVDWPSLRAQVHQWQAAAQLGWDDGDVEQVARHLNDTHYRFPPPAGARVLSQATPAQRP